MRDKKGISNVVTTLIFILLAIIAIGIVWVVVSGILDQSSGSVDIGTKCIGVDITPTNLTCDDATAANRKCSVVINRGVGDTKDISGVKIVVINGTDSDSKDVEGNIPVSATVTKETDAWVADANQVTVAAYFVNDAGEIDYCPNPESYTKPSA